MTQLTHKPKSAHQRNPKHQQTKCNTKRPGKITFVLPQNSNDQQTKKQLTAHIQAIHNPVNQTSNNCKTKAMTYQISVCSPLHIKQITHYGERSRRAALRAPWRPAARRECLSPLCASTDFWPLRRPFGHV